MEKNLLFVLVITFVLCSFIQTDPIFATVPQVRYGVEPGTSVDIPTQLDFQGRALTLGKPTVVMFLQISQDPFDRIMLDLAEYWAAKYPAIQFAMVERAGRESVIWIFCD